MESFANEPAAIPTLVSGINATVDTFTVDSWPYHAAHTTENFRIRIDNEYMFVGTRVGNVLSNIVRDAEEPGSAAVHSAGAQVRVVLTRASLFELLKYAEIKELDDVDWTTPPTDGQILVWDNAAQKFVPEDFHLDNMRDTDIVAPSGGQVLTYDGISGKWEPGSGFTGSGAIGHTYIGYNTVGASLEGFTNFRQYEKQVVLAQDGLIASIGAYLKQVTDSVYGINVGILNDNAGVPGDTIHAMNGTNHAVAYGPIMGTSSWVDVPIGFWAPAGTYWICFQINTNSGTLQLHYDAGSDHYTTPNSQYISGQSRWGDNTTARKYSIRASFLV